MKKKNEFNTYHTFIIQTKKRNALKKYLLAKNIQTAIHYPIPIHLQPASKKFGYGKGDFPICEKQANNILTLPIHQFLNTKSINIIIKEINRFFE